MDSTDEGMHQVEQDGRILIEAVAKKEAEQQESANIASPHIASCM